MAENGIPLWRIRVSLVGELGFQKILVVMGCRQASAFAENRFSARYLRNEFRLHKQLRCLAT